MSLIPKLSEKINELKMLVFEKQHTLFLNQLLQYSNHIKNYQNGCLDIVENMYSLINRFLKSRFEETSIISNDQYIEMKLSFKKSSIQTLSFIDEGNDDHVILKQILEETISLC